MQSIVRGLVPCILFLAGAGAWNEARAQDAQAGDPNAGKLFFQQSCAVCHSDALGAGNAAVVKQGPSLVGVVGRHAGSTPNFNYTKALSGSGLTWDAATLDNFLTNPAKLVPGTTMPIPVPVAANRQNVIAYLSTLKMPDNIAAAPPAAATPAPPPANDPGDWHHAAPGVKHHITVADLPAPFATTSSGNGPKVVPQPAGAALSVPPGFTVKLFATGLTNPRLIRVAPNGDIFIAETAANRIRVMRAADGAEAPAENQIFADRLNLPFGISFYPPGNDPRWIYVANNNSVVRFAYHNGDLKAGGAPEVIVPRLTESQGGHSTRDVVFSKDGKRMFISVGSGSNVADGMSKKTADDAHAWEAGRGMGRRDQSRGRAGDRSRREAAAESVCERHSQRGDPGRG